jgi:hypothetical protein
MSETAQIALCRLIERNNHWEPVGWGTQLNASHRNTPDGPIHYAEIYADISGGEIVGWRKAGFNALEVRADGSVDLRIGDLVLILEADENDRLAAVAGAVGISRKISGRREEWDQSRISKKQRAAAYDRAIIQIKDRLAGHRVKGVTLIDAQ